MKHLRLAAAFALLTAPAFAQDTQELAEAYVNMPEVQNMMTQMFSPEAMGQQIAASLPPGMSMTESQQTQVGEVMSEAMNDLRPRLQELMIEGSAETYSADELQALIDFYGSEHGAAVMAKMQPMMVRTMAELAPEVQALQAEIGPRIAEIMRGEN